MKWFIMFYVISSCIHNEINRLKVMIKIQSRLGIEKKWIEWRIEIVIINIKNRFGNK